jgi:hypothetical protein
LRRGPSRDSTRKNEIIFLSGPRISRRLWKRGRVRSRDRRQPLRSRASGECLRIRTKVFRTRSWRQNRSNCLT